MESLDGAAERTKASSLSVHPRHLKLIHAIRVKRAVTPGEIPKANEITHEAIERLAAAELGADRVDELTAVAS